MSYNSSSPPNSQEIFHALNVLKSVFGYQQFRQGQEEVIQATLQGKDSLVVMATGGGKSLCYQIPALVLEGITLVVSPLISLMQDQVEQLQSYGVKANFLNSSQMLEQQQLIQNQAMNGELKLLYVSPEKLLSRSFFHFISQCRVNFIAIDEAHCISQWGHDFRVEYTKLSHLKQAFFNVPIMALTATADETTRQDIIQHLNLHEPYCYIGSFERHNINYTVVEKYQGTQQLYKFIQSQKIANQKLSGIVYCNSRKKAENLSLSLQKKGISAQAYHAGMSAIDRERIQKAFQTDTVQVIIATIAFGMGINKPNVRFVVHYDLPRSIESYYQETGRAGRDNLPSKCVLFYKTSDFTWLHQNLLEKNPSYQQQIEIQKLFAMRDFAESSICRKQVLLNYFGEPKLEGCNNCDICLNPPKKYAGLQDAQKIMSTIFRTGQNFGTSYVIDVLRGMHNAKILALGHEKLSVYGLGKEHSKEYWQAILRQLIHLGLVKQSFNPQNSSSSILSLTPLSKEYLRGEKDLALAIPRLSTQLLSHTTFNTSGTKDLIDKDLLERLKFLRKQIAQRQQVPSYIIFSDLTLQEMALYKPQTLVEMLEINGVGEKKLANYGEEFLQILQQFK